MFSRADYLLGRAMRHSKRCQGADRKIALSSNRIRLTEPGWQRREVLDEDAVL